jgi:hypothetical protein
MTDRLSILCVTEAEPHAEPFLLSMLDLATHCEAELVVACDGLDAFERVLEMPRVADNADVSMVESKGYVESVLDYALRRVSSEWVLRLDDDERVNPPLALWLVERDFVREPLWSFRRVNLWQDARHALDTALLWPDPQTRLSRRELAGGRKSIHVASPAGSGLRDPAPSASEVSGEVARRPPAIARNTKP